VAGLFSVRNTTIGAGVLIVLTVLFTDRSGYGGSAVAPAAQSDRAAAVPKPSATPTIAPKQWFAASGNEPEPVISPAPSVASQVPPSDPDEIRQPDPVGPDFPPELNRRG
jgi:hypothetical protein